MNMLGTWGDLFEISEDNSRLSYSSQMNNTAYMLLSQQLLLPEKLHWNKPAAYRVIMATTN